MRGALPLLCAVLLSCSKREPPPPERTEPWPAHPVASASTGPTHKLRYRIDERCALGVELPAKEATPRGSLRVARGELDVDLMSLERTRGTVEIDVASLAMELDGDAGGEDYTEQARSWLDVGANRPEAERERLRWATFTISDVSDPSASAAHEGKRQAVAPDADGAAIGEERAITANVSGAFSLHGFRVERELRVRAVFRYAAPAVAGAVPSALRVEFVRFVPVSLEAHDIKPRDASGVFVAQQTKLLGVRVGREARVNGWLSATPAR